MTSGPKKIDFQITLQDDGSGVLAFSLSGQPIIFTGDPLIEYEQFVAQPNANKPIQSNFSWTIDQVTANGTYIFSLVAVDNNFNELYVDRRGLAVQGFPYEIRVINSNNDIKDPELIQITPLVLTTLNASTAIDITATPELVFELELYDDFSGIQSIELILSSSSSGAFPANISVDSDDYRYPRGDIKFKTNATFSLTFLPSGKYTLALYLRDFDGRRTIVTSNNLTTIFGLPPFIKLGDTAPPDLIKITSLVPSSLNASTVINTTATPELVFALELFDDFSGILAARFTLQTFGCLQDFILNVDDFPGGGFSFKTNATLSLTGLPSGDYELSFYLSDFAGFNSFFGNDDLALSFGLPLVIKLASSQR